MENMTHSMIAFMQEHGRWAVPIVFALAFCESFAFISLFVPATAVLLGIGGFIAAAGFDFWSIWSGAALGAIAGDWLAYSLAFHFKDHVRCMWPFSKDQKLLARGIKFFERWGTIAVFSGRFFGPFRAIVPIVAGIYAMPWIYFQIANFASAALWATGILTPGFLSIRWLVG